LWFIDADSMIVDDPGLTSPRFLNQDDRIAVGDGLHAGHSVRQIAAPIGNNYETVYREIRRHSKPDGRYQPWWAHNQARLRRVAAELNDRPRKVLGDKTPAEAVKGGRGNLSPPN
jgi:IS30 family transposase